MVQIASGYFSNVVSAAGRDKYLLNFFSPSQLRWIVDFSLFLINCAPVVGAHTENGNHFRTIEPLFPLKRTTVLQNTVTAENRAKRLKSVAPDRERR